MKKLLAIILLMLCVITNTYVYADEEDVEYIEYNEIISEIGAAQVTAEVENTPQINSKHAIVYDRVSGSILYGKKENEKCKMASTTKIMTSIVVLENANLTDIVEVSKKAAGIGGSRLGLKVKDKITVNDLLYGLMLCSGNDAAIALAEHVGEDVQGFANLMNQKVKELKLENTNFVTPHGLDEEEHYTTAYELARIADYALKNPKFAEIVRTKNYTVTINGNAKNLNNSNELLGVLNGVYGVKTGFTNGANRCLVTSVKRGELDIICVVLGADTKKMRTKDSIKLIEFVYSKYEMVNIKEILENSEEWKNVQQRKVQTEKGVKNKLDIELDKMEIEKYAIEKQQIKDITVHINVLDTVEATVEKGKIVGSLQVRIDEDLICNVNIVAKENIEKKGILDYLKFFLNAYRGEQY